MSLANAGFKDHFSGHAGAYAEYRPGYPAALFEWLSGVAPSRRLAWDSATGNGQAAVLLSDHFENVVACDASAKQIENAARRTNIRYLVETAEHSSLDAGTVDLATVAQAYHWYAHDEFHAELDRVVKPGGLLAVLAYPLARISDAVDRVVLDLYDGCLVDYWPAERRFVDRGYRDFGMPWPELVTPEFEMRAMWTLEHLVGYLNTWSSVGKYKQKHGSSPVTPMVDALSTAWGDVPQREIRWPMILRVCRKPVR